MALVMEPLVAEPVMALVVEPLVAEPVMAIFFFQGNAEYRHSEGIGNCFKQTKYGKMLQK